jgi:hypothetical protein
MYLLMIRDSNPALRTRIGNHWSEILEWKRCNVAFFSKESGYLIDCWQLSLGITMRYRPWQIGIGSIVSGRLPIRLYRDACQLEPDRFSRAAPLPEYPTLSRYRSFHGVGTLVDVTLEINERGVPSDIAVSPVGDISSISVKRKLRDTRYRPAFDQCETPRDISLINAQFVFLD